MTRLFDGLAGLLNDTFGGPVTHTPSGGAAVTIQARFRRDAVETLDENGEGVLVNNPTLMVPEPTAATINTGDQITPDNGVTYTVLNRHDSGSPASDAFVTFELRKP